MPPRRRPVPACRSPAVAEFAPGSTNRTPAHSRLISAAERPSPPARQYQGAAKSQKPLAPPGQVQRLVRLNGAQSRAISDSQLAQHLHEVVPPAESGTGTAVHPTSRRETATHRRQ